MKTLPLVVDGGMGATLPPRAVRSAAQRCRELDAVRGIAAMLVVFFHYTVRYGDLFGDLAAPFHATYGFLGVQVFFGVSGFVILMTLERCRTPLDFVRARALRLYPAYWTALLITFVVLLVFPLPGRTPGWWQGAVNLTMLQAFVNVPHIDGAYWSLEVELVFYAWMLAIFATGWMRNVRWWIVLWLALSIGILVAARLLHRSVPTLADRYLLVEYSAYFSIGAAAYLDFRAMRIDRTTWALFALALAAAWLSAGLQGLLVAAAMVLLFSLIVLRRAALLNTPLLVFLGTVSYPLYLLHQNIGYVIINRLRDHGFEYGWAVAIAFGVSLAAAAALTFGVERPVQRRVHLWLKRRSSGGPPLDAARPT
ncbi:acyltransferase family protein [Scleromatobacter humisilvae]|uniref:Acyltransferase n=1 Tax=Scleromatobacter humisilvae TaxID=2897159 RepID=A0A9X2C0K8_9BURK|nr:acyltransferase [Scleromatobacter humisilvae]MCK9686506.1 acyltransferase [Scleromatobacter humisilvae]